MKRSFITYHLSLLLLFAPSAAVSAIAIGVSNTEDVYGVNDDRNTRILANLKLARHCLENENYAMAKEKAMIVLELAPNHQEALSIVEECNRQEARQREREQEAFEEACQAGTVDALNSFIRLFPNSSFVAEAQARIDDYSIWSQAQQEATVQAYENYLANSTVRAYENEAQRAISTLKAAAEWEQLKTSTSIADLEDFRSRYPNSAKDAEVQQRLNLLKGEQSYQDGHHDQAIDFFDQYKSSAPLEGQYLEHYNELLLEREYNNIKNSTDVDRLMPFLNRLTPSHRYYNDISNQIAIGLAQNLGQHSSDADFETALRYAVNPATRTTVEQNIDRAREARRDYNRRQRSLAHELWWERNLMFGWNMFGMDFWKNTSSFRSGLRIKLGTHQDVFNISLGADYVYHAFTQTLKKNNGKEDISFHPVCHQVAVPLNIKLNFTNGDNKCSFYFGCAAEYAYTFGKASDYKDLCNDYTLAFEPQIGLNWKSVDWGFYWRKYLGGYTLLKKGAEYVTDEIPADQRVGMYFVAYF
jgi:outer membrane protein assembly factor BamD (BamD/ComL family)